MSDAEFVRVSQQFTLAWDPAKQRDYSAICVMERVKLRAYELVQNGFEVPMTQTHEAEEFHVRHLQRLAKGTNFVEQVEIVAALFNALPATREEAALCIDSGGLGKPLVDLAKKKGLRPVSILLTGGQAETRVSRFELHVPRRVILTNLAVLIQNKMLKVAPDLAEAETLATELANVRLRAFASESSNDNVADDLAFSVALASYYQTRRPTPLRIIKGSAYMGR
jgi:hypothetical protein